MGNNHTQGRPGRLTGTSFKGKHHCPLDHHLNLCVSPRDSWDPPTVSQLLHRDTLWPRWTVMHCYIYVLPLAFANLDSPTAGTTMGERSSSWCQGTGRAERLERERMNERMRAKSGKIQVRADQGQDCFCLTASRSQKTLDEVTLLWPKSQKPIFPQGVILIFPFSIYRWFHKNSWKTETEFWLTSAWKSFLWVWAGSYTFLIGCNLANHPQKRTEIPEFELKEKFDCWRKLLIAEQPFFRHCKRMILKHKIKALCFFRPISNRSWPLELNRFLSSSPKLKTRWMEDFLFCFLIYRYMLISVWQKLFSW